MGMGPESVKGGDLVVILFGGKIPYVLRCTGPHCYTLVGECYVPGTKGRAGCRGGGERQVPDGRSLSSFEADPPLG